jgi:hypothetical protein
MTFTDDNLTKVLAGTKTQTRRRVTENDWIARASGEMCWDFRYGESVAWVGGSDRHRFRVGQIVVVQPGRGQRAVGHIRITEICYCARACDLSADDTHAEGFASVEEFRETYARLNGRAVLDRSCWALTFELVT